MGWETLLLANVKCHVAKAPFIWPIYLLKILFLYPQFYFSTLLFVKTNAKGETKETKYALSFHVDTHHQQIPATLPQRPLHN